MPPGSSISVCGGAEYPNQQRFGSCSGEVWFMILSSQAPNQAVWPRLWFGSVPTSIIYYQGQNCSFVFLKKVFGLSADMRVLLATILHI